MLHDEQAGYPNVPHHLRNVPRRRRLNLDWISCDPPLKDLTPFETFTRNVKWESTRFGPVANWDEQLRTAVLICLADPEPAALLWGDDQAMIYNEAYTPLIGTIHPQLQGQAARPIFGDLWDDYEANYRTCENTGGFVSHPGLLTMMTRFGYEEECYFSFKWAPYIGKDGNLTGVYASCSDTTHSIILSRRLDWAGTLSSAVAPVKDLESLWKLLPEYIERAPLDIPNLMIYSKLSAGVSPTRTSTLTLEACVGVQSRQIAAVRQVDLECSAGYASAMRRAAESRSIVVLREAAGELPPSFLEELEPRGFNTRSVEMAICPIFSGMEAVCYVIFGLSPKKRFDHTYESFLRGITEDIIGAKIGGILLAQEKERGRMLAKSAEDERNRRIQELERSELKHRQFAESAPLGMIRVDLKGDLVFANAAWKRILGHDDADSKIRPWLNKVHPDYRESAIKFFEDILKVGGPLTTEHQLVQDYSDGSEEYPTWVLVTGYREDDEHIICWVTDISAQKAAAVSLNEKMEEAILQKTRQENFIDMISHEIRNPLSAVLHCSEDIIRCAERLVKGENLSSSTLRGCLESAQTISYCVEHQKRIVDDVLTLSKLDADLLEIALVPVEPRKAIRNALHIFDRELKESHISMNIVEDDSLARHNISMLMLDPNRFLQVLINLVTNSIKFTRSSPTREITVTISASTDRPAPAQVRLFPSIKRSSGSEANSTPPSPITSDSLYLTISVSDTGKGLSNAESQRLFNRFAQASPKTHIEYGGSGLGLFISRQIVEMMGGQIGIRHEQEVGCTFTFFVQTTRATEQLEDIARDLLRINLTHHPLTPVLRSPASSVNTPPTAATPVEGAVSTLRIQVGDDVSIALADTTETQLPTVEIHAPKEKPPSPVSTGRPNARPTKVLCVEDNLINQRIVCKQLKARGYEVHAANHGVEALQALEAARTQPDGNYFDIVLCDIEMPVMDGIACVKEIRRLEGKEMLPGPIPVVAVTANARSTHVETAIAAGMDDVTTKPYRMDELAAQIERMVSRVEREDVDVG